MILSDNYVHRLVQNKEDGKLVEVATQSQQLPGDQKIDSLQLEVHVHTVAYGTAASW